MTVWRWYDGWWERPIHRRWPEEKEKRGGSHSEHCVTDGAQPTQAYTSKVAKSRYAACTAPTDGIFCIKARLPLWSLGWKSAVMAASPIKWPPHLFYDWPHSILSNFSSIFYRCCCCHYNISDHFSPLLYSFWGSEKEREKGRLWNIWARTTNKITSINRESGEEFLRSGAWENLIKWIQAGRHIMYIR